MRRLMVCGECSQAWPREGSNGCRGSMSEGGEQRCRVRVLGMLVALRRW